jgi:hypothetical protein
MPWNVAQSQRRPIVSDAGRFPDAERQHAVEIAVAGDKAHLEHAAIFQEGFSR